MFNTSTTASEQTHGTSKEFSVQGIFYKFFTAWLLKYTMCLIKSETLVSETECWMSIGVQSEKTNPSLVNTEIRAEG